MTEPATTETTQTEQTPATEPAATAAPLTYAADAPPPDYSGLKLPADHAAAAMLAEFAQAHKVPADALQAQIDKLVQSEGEAKAAAEKAAADAQAAAEKQWADQVAGWQAELKADREIGGAKFDENIAHARKWVQAYGGEPLQKLLDESGLAHHPALIRAFVKAGKDAAEAPVIPSTRDAPADTGVIFDYSKSRAA